MKHGKVTILILMFYLGLGVEHSWAGEVRVYANREIKPVVLQLIQGAQQSLDIQMYTFTDQDVIRTLQAARARGVGYALMAAVAAETVRGGGVTLDWGVHAANAGALAFYRRLGAAGGESRIMGMSGERLRALAAAAAR